jgi:hypothetical protein
MLLIKVSLSLVAMQSQEALQEGAANIWQWKWQPTLKLSPSSGQLW